MAEEELITIQLRARKRGDNTDWKDIQLVNRLVYEVGIKSACRQLAKESDTTQVRWNYKGSPIGHYYILADPGQYAGKGQSIS